MNFNLFIRCLGHTKELHLRRLVKFPILKKDNKEKYKLFVMRMYFQDTLLLPRQTATKARINRLHVVTVLDFVGATRKENMKH